MVKRVVFNALLGSVSAHRRTEVFSALGTTRSTTGGPPVPTSSTAVIDRRYNKTARTGKVRAVSSTRRKARLNQKVQDRLTLPTLLPAAEVFGTRGEPLCLKKASPPFV
jgi:hypothetical protein